MIAIQEGKKSFHTLFNTYRLQSGIESLSELGELLAEKQIMYDESIFSKWKRGERIPRDRHVLLALITIFIEKQALRTLEEADAFLQTADVRELTETESEQFRQRIHAAYPFFVPDEISPLVIREKYLKEICWKILNASSVILSGMPGSGKTALAITAAHTLRQSFVGGVYWFQCTRKSLSDVLDSIGLTLGQPIAHIETLPMKASIIKKLLENKRVLLVFDDIQEISDFIYFFPQNRATSYIFILTNRKFTQETAYSSIRITPFTFQEALSLTEQILGTPFVTVNRTKLTDLSRLVGNSPLALSLLIKRLEKEPLKLDTFLSQLHTGNFFPLQRKNTNMSQSLDLAFTSLSKPLQSFFLSLGVFSSDFSVDAVAWLHDISFQQAEKNISSLHSFSLLEKSTYGNYRVHPLLKLFIIHRFQNVSFYEKTLLFYKMLLQNPENFNRIERSLLTIEFLFEKCFVNKYYETLLIVWRDFQRILWEKGYWILYRKLGELVYQSCFFLNDDAFRMELCINELSLCYLWQGERQIAEKYVREGLTLALAANDAFVLACARQRLGKLLQIKGAFQEALEESFAAVGYFQSHGLFKKGVDTLPDIAGVYWAMKDTEKAIHFLKEALSLASAIKNVRQQAYIHIFFGCVYLSQKEYEQAELSFEKSIKLESAFHKTPDVLFWTNLGLGLTAQAKKQEKDAYRLFKKAKEQKDNLGMNQSIISYRMFFAPFINRIPEFLV